MLNYANVTGPIDAGLLKINSMLAGCENLKLISANEIIKYDIVAHATTELHMEDGSIFIFEDHAASSECNIRAIYNYNENNEFCIDLDNLRQYHKINEDVVGYKYRNKNIIEVDEYIVAGKKVIRLKF